MTSSPNVPSPLSQSLGTNILYPSGLSEVLLTEVVRCSKRIVSAASSFQIGGEAKLETKCHHDSEGPPLKTFLFDLKDESKRHAEYAAQVTLALADVVKGFPTLSLQGRLAILVPDADFLSGVKPLLLAAMRDHFAPRTFNLIDASEASAMSMGGKAGGGKAGAELLVLDTIDNFDGLERLIVISVGLDVVIDATKDGAKSTAKEGDDDPTLETRSRLYRALTRSHMVAIVVNEVLHGGWLECTLRAEPAHIPPAHPHVRARPRARTLR